MHRMKMERTADWGIWGRMDGVARREIVGLRGIIRMGRDICHISQK
jgi:hypothetical protein